MKVSLTEDELQEYEETIEKLNAMTKEERLKWFEENSEDDFAFGYEMDGTTYIARCIFGDNGSETMLEKTCRILTKDEIA